MSSYSKPSSSFQKQIPYQKLQKSKERNIKPADNKKPTNISTGDIGNIKCNTKEEWAEILQEQRNFSLRRDNLPWWEFVLIINGGKGDHILLFRFDHGLGDGISLSKVFTKAIKRIDGSEIQSMLPPSMISNKAKAKSNLWRMLWKLPRAILDVAMSPNGRGDDPTCFSKNLIGSNIVSTIILSIVLYLKSNKENSSSIRLSRLTIAVESCLFLSPFHLIL